ncbi:MAG: hypothetical protein AAGD38_20025, partial [Acidobacteriota bacterium]
MDLLQDFDYLIRIGRIYNTKEDEAYQLLLEKRAEGATSLDELNERVQWFHHRVEERIESCGHLVKEFRSILDWMQVCRWAGVNSFLLILITSAVLVSETLATIFVVLTVLAYSYTWLDDLLKRKRVRLLMDRAFRRRDHPPGT